MEPFSPTAPHSEAPGAKGARTCGILAIVFALTCVGIPVALVLGIVALVLQAKAKRRAQEAPDTYRVPTQTGLVTGIIGLVLPVLLLPFIGIGSAIAIPALLSQRTRARDRAATSMLIGRMTDMVGEFDNQIGLGRTEPEIRKHLEERLQQSGANDKNPWNPEAPAHSFSIQVLTGADQPAMEDAVRTMATVKGQCVYAIQFPRTETNGMAQPGFLAGAVASESMPHQATPGPFVKIIPLD